MADEKDMIIGEIKQGIAEIKTKADQVDGIAKKADNAVIQATGAALTAEEAKKAAENAAKEASEAKVTLKSISDWQVTKDERDNLNQKALNEIIAGQTKIQLKSDQENPEPFGKVLADTLDVKENKEQFDEFLRKGTGKLKMQLKAVADMTFAGQFSTANASVTGVRSGIVQLPNRKRHIRTLIPTTSMTGSSLTYMKEGAGEGAMTTVAEGALKPQIDLDLSEVVVPNQYIAGWLRISRKMLDDTQGMTAYLNTRLPEKLMVAEDNQLINGNGTSPNLSGILDGGNFTAASGAATVDIEQVIEAIAQLEDSFENTATGILVRPAQYMSFFLNKAAGSGEYDMPNNVTFSNGTLSIAGVPIYASTAIAADSFIVGDFANGAQLFIREAPSIVFAYEDGINIRENMVTVRIEERVALAVYGAGYFISGDFGNVA